MAKEPIYLDIYALQQDMRIRLYKSILNNLLVDKRTKEKNELILRIADTPKEDIE